MGMETTGQPESTEELADAERDAILRDLIGVVAADRLPSAAAGSRDKVQAQARRAAVNSVLSDLVGLRDDPCPAAPTPAPAEDDIGEEDPAQIRPLRCVRKKVVTVRRHERHVVITFTARFARAYGISRYDFVAVRRDDAAGAVSFVFTNNPAFERGVFSLGFNGGSSKVAGSAGRIVQLRPEVIPLEQGDYVPRVTYDDGARLVVSIVPE
jgi:hypothetical protein